MLLSPIKPRLGGTPTFTLGLLGRGCSPPRGPPLPLASSHSGARLCPTGTAWGALVVYHPPHSLQKQAYRATPPRMPRPLRALLWPLCPAGHVSRALSAAVMRVSFVHCCGAAALPRVRVPIGAPSRAAVRLGGVVAHVSPLRGALSAFTIPSMACCGTGRAAALGRHISGPSPSGAPPLNVSAMAGASLTLRWCGGARTCWCSPWL